MIRRIHKVFSITFVGVTQDKYELVVVLSLYRTFFGEDDGLLIVETG